jgi:hypothetical protein
MVLWGRFYCGWVKLIGSGVAHSKIELEMGDAQLKMMSTKAKMGSIASFRVKSTRHGAIMSMIQREWMGTTR